MRASLAIHDVRGQSGLRVVEVLPHLAEDIVAYQELPTRYAEYVSSISQYRNQVRNYTMRREVD